MTAPQPHAVKPATPTAVDPAAQLRASRDRLSDLQREEAEIAGHIRSAILAEDRRAGDPGAGVEGEEGARAQRREVPDVRQAAAVVRALRPSAPAAQDRDQAEAIEAA